MLSRRNYSSAPPSGSTAGLEERRLGLVPRAVRVQLHLEVWLRRGLLGEVRAFRGFFPVAGFLKHRVHFDACQFNGDFAGKQMR